MRKLILPAKHECKVTGSSGEILEEVLVSGPSIISDNKGEVVAVDFLLGQFSGVVGCFSWLLLLLAVPQSTSSFLALS